MAKIVPVTWEEVEVQAEAIATRHPGALSVYGVPTSGASPAVMVARHIGVPLVEKPQPGTLVVDDLVDSGKTLKLYEGWKRDACFRKAHSPKDLAPDARLMEGWLTFPWEKEEGDPQDLVVRLLEYIGEDPTREGLQDTPKRVLKAWSEMTQGYQIHDHDTLNAVFNDQTDQMVVLSGIEFVSNCEHHLLPFTGTATIGYVPDGKIIGISKLARVVHQYSKRLQVQERMTEQIAEAIESRLKPLGVGVVVQGHHECMSCRGVQQPRTTMTTSAMRGVFLSKPEARAEFLSLARNTSGH